MGEKNTHNESFEELAAAYVLGALDAEERRAFEAILRSADESDVRLFNELQAAANQIAFTVEAEKPSPDVKEKLMQHIQSSRSEIPSKSDGRSNRFVLAVAASFALLIITVALIFYTFNLFDSINDKEQLIAWQQATITELRNEVQQREELLGILSAQTVDLVLMSGMEVNTEGYGKIIWDPENEQALLQVSNLPPEPAGKDYQLWLFKNNKPMPAGVFSVHTLGEASFFRIEEMPSVNQQAASAFAVTLEPEGGMPQPTGDIYLMGSEE